MAPCYGDLTSISISNEFNVKDNFKHLSQNDIIAHQQSIAKDFAVCCLNVTGDLNVGNILRTAVLFGAKRFYVLGRRKFDKRSTVGGEHYIEIVKEDCLLDDQLTLDVDRVGQILRRDGLVPIWVEQSEQSTHLHAFDWQHCIANMPYGYIPCLMFGNEGIGIPKPLMEHYGKVVEIPSIGVMRSLNVSSAASIVMYDLCRSMQWF